MHAGHLFTILIATLVAAHAHSAPTTSVPDGAVVTEVAAPDATADATTGAKTIDRLLQLKNDAKPVEANNPAQGAAPAKVLTPGTLPLKAGIQEAAVASAPAPNPLVQLQAAILGERESGGAPGRSQDPSGSNPQRMSGDRPTSMSPTLAGGTAGGSQGGAAGASAERGSGPVMMAAQFIREHRLAVIATSVIVVLMVWGATAFSSQRRR